MDRAYLLRKKLCGCSSIPSSFGFLLLSSANHRHVHLREVLPTAKLCCIFNIKGTCALLLFVCAALPIPLEGCSSPELALGHHRRARSCLIDLCWQRWADFYCLPAASFQVRRVNPAEGTTEVNMVTSGFGRGHTTQATAPAVPT